MLREKIFIPFVSIIAFASCMTLVTATPIVVINGIYIDDIVPSEGPPGTKVLIFGGGATPDGLVVATFSTFPVGRTFAYEDGSWEIWFEVPSVSPGEYTVYVVDNTTQTSDSTVFVVTAAQIRIDYVSPTTGPPGTMVYVSGSRATPNDEVKVYFDDMNVANTTAEEWGWWSVSFRVPNVEPGKYIITALDVASNTTDTASFTVTPPPTIYVSPSEAPIGSKINIRGEGFPSKTGLFLTFEDLVIFSIITTDEKGEFNVTVFVPMVNSGDYRIKAATTYPYPIATISSVSFTVTEGVDTLLSGVPPGFKKRNEASDNPNNEPDSLKADHSILNSAYNGLKSTIDVAGNWNNVFIMTTIVFMATTIYLMTKKPKTKSPSPP